MRSQAKLELPSLPSYIRSDQTFRGHAALLLAIQRLAEQTEASTPLSELEQRAANLVSRRAAFLIEREARRAKETKRQREIRFTLERVRREEAHAPHRLSSRRPRISPTNNSSSRSRGQHTRTRRSPRRRVTTQSRASGGGDPPGGFCLARHRLRGLA